jgi:hypothetical protein
MNTVIYGYIELDCNNLQKRNKMKRCYKCKIEKDESCFQKRKSSKDGLQEKCKDCIRIRNTEYYQENKEYITNKRAEYYQENKYTTVAEYRQKNKKTIAIKKSEWYQKNREYILIQTAEYEQKNKDKRANRIKKRRQNDPSFKFYDAFSTLFKGYLKSNGINKNNISTFTILGYTPEEVRTHIRSLFAHPDNLDHNGKVWMNEHNQGVYRRSEWDDNDSSTWKWQIDHRKPKSEFNCSSINDSKLKECWALNNLRPYSAKQNNIDGASMIRHQNKSRKMFK